MLSPKAREYFQSQKQTLEEFIQVLQMNIAAGREVVAEKDKQIESLSAGHEERQQQIDRLVAERDEIKQNLADVEAKAAATVPFGNTADFQWSYLTLDHEAIGAGWSDLASSNSTLVNSLTANSTVWSSGPPLPRSQISRPICEI
jgi:flagellar biosynthesis chaperone FliJ